jgi:hypothetical protein
LRIWPNQIDETQTVKDLTVTIAGTPPFNCSLERRCATVIPIFSAAPPTDISECLAGLELVTDGDRITDEYGEFPVLRFKKLEFVVWESDSRTQQFGLKQIRLFNLQGDSIMLPPEICLLTVVGCGTCAKLDLLVPTGKPTESLQDTWIGQFAEPRPRIAITFPEPVAISAIEIENGDIFEEDDVALKFMQVFADDVSVWSGRLNRRQVGSVEAQRGVTFVFFVQSQEIQGKIRNRTVLPMRTGKHRP